MGAPKRPIALLMLDHLDEYGSASVDNLAAFVFGSSAWWSRRRVMESLRISERDGLVKITGEPTPSGKRVVRRTRKERPQPKEAA